MDTAVRSSVPTMAGGSSSVILPGASRSGIPRRAPSQSAPEEEPQDDTSTATMTTLTARRIQNQACSPAGAGAYWRVEHGLAERVSQGPGAGLLHRFSPGGIARSRCPPGG
jgi:hypothetical protein